VPHSTQDASRSFRAAHDSASRGRNVTLDVICLIMDAISRPISFSAFWGNGLHATSSAQEQIPITSRSVHTHMTSMLADAMRAQSLLMPPLERAPQLRVQSARAHGLEMQEPTHLVPATSSLSAPTSKIHRSNAGHSNAGINALGACHELFVRVDFECPPFQHVVRGIVGHSQHHLLQLAPRYPVLHLPSQRTQVLL
jgi:hypothetical protein